MWSHLCRHRRVRLRRFGAADTPSDDRLRHVVPAWPVRGRPRLRGAGLIDRAIGGSALSRLLVFLAWALGDGAGRSALVLLLRMTATDTSLPSTIDDGLRLHGARSSLGFSATARPSRGCQAEPRSYQGADGEHTRSGDTHQRALRCPTGVRRAERRSTQMRAVSPLTVAHPTGRPTSRLHGRTGSLGGSGLIGYRAAHAKTPSPRRLRCRGCARDHRLLR